MRILPAIDIIDGKCVRLTQGDYAQKKIYNENPLDVARQFEQEGLKFLHLVDLDGAKAGRVINWNVIESIARETSLTVDFGGGIKTENEIERLLDIGVTQVNVGSIAVKEKNKVFSWIKIFGRKKIILSADVKDEEIAIHGWQSNSGLNLFDLVGEYVENGIEYVTCTDIQTDGMLKGPNTALYKKLINRFPTLKIVASGGVSSLEDLVQLKQSGVDGAIVGKAIYEERIQVKDLVTL
jgi:phosphoribosylformimino-5-aminoimidazole carboxamide ribotide isomerase